MADIEELYRQTFGCAPTAFEPIAACGSDRRYFRLKGVDGSVIGCINADVKENGAFVSFARSFRAAGLPVPEIYGVSADGSAYLQQDLGGETLYDRVAKDWLPLADEPAAVFPEALESLYRKVLEQLVKLQLTGRKVIDYSKCTPCPAFHRDAIHWDLNYFKYFFLKLTRTAFDEQALEDDFRTLADYLLSVPHDAFLYRDFQSANVMLAGDEPWFIDFQGGRRGALPYDPASMLFDAKTRLPKAVRDRLTDFYYDSLTRQLPLLAPDLPLPSRSDFMAAFRGYTLVRLMQALGAFGLRGLVEHKPGFAESIPPALALVRECFETDALPVALPELRRLACHRGL